MKKHIDDVRKNASEGPFKRNKHATMAIETDGHRTVASCGAFFDSTQEDGGEAENLANVALILHCLNNFQPLLDAMRSFVNGVEKYGDADIKARLSGHLQRHKEAIEAAEQVEVTE